MLPPTARTAPYATNIMSGTCMGSQLGPKATEMSNSPATITEREKTIR